MIDVSTLRSPTVTRTATTTARENHIPFSYAAYSPKPERRLKPLARVPSVGNLHQQRPSPPRTDLTVKAIVRSLLLPRIIWEAPFIASAQAKCPAWLLSLMSVFGLLGTHAAFMLLLPPLFWFDLEDAQADHELKRFGRGFVICLLFGVYVSAAVKDFLCLPRPLSPPVRRMTATASISLEYGFPSTHTMNATTISMHTALYLLSASMGAASTVAGQNEPMSMTTSAALFLLVAYSVIMGGSRILTGMHSFMDVMGGAWLGVAVVGLWWYGGMGTMVEALITDSFMGVNVPAVILPLLILSIYIHPNPDGPCPCFEDSVASISVVAGVILGSWHHGAYTAVGGTSAISGVIRLAVGIACVYGFRKAAKRTSKGVFEAILGPDAPHMGHAHGGEAVEDIDQCEGRAVPKEVKEVALSKYVIKRLTVKSMTDGVVYGGIGILAVDVIPSLFVWMGI
ncbi:hypothetical protein HK101_002536 [Irineochytrium annulatum]|nr:hypothetical protein HK101_002536 [Irineochytrium annulatum]